MIQADVAAESADALVDTPETNLGTDGGVAGDDTGDSTDARVIPRSAGEDETVLVVADGTRTG